MADHIYIIHFNFLLIFIQYSLIIFLIAVLSSKIFPIFFICYYHYSIVLFQTEYSLISHFFYLILSIQYLKIIQTFEIDPHNFLIIASLVNFIIVFFKIYYYYDKYLLVIIFLQDLHFNYHYFPCHKALNYFLGQFIIYFYLKIIMCLFPMTLFFKGYNHNFIFNLFMESIILILIF